MGKYLGGCAGHDQVKGIYLAAFECSYGETGRKDAAGTPGNQKGQFLGHRQISHRVG